MTMPTLIAKHRAMVYQTSFKKCVSNLYQAYERTKFELGVENIFQTYIIYDEESHYVTTSKEFRETFEKQLKIVDQYKDSFYPIQNYNGTKVVETNAGNDYPTATKILADGSSFGIHVNSDGNGAANVHLYIDTNGPYKKPNKYGHDIFKFQIRRDNKLVPVAMTKLYTEEELENVTYPDLKGYPCSIKSKQATNGAGCAYYAMNNTNPDDPTKKYWESLP